MYTVTVDGRDFRFARADRALLFDGVARSLGARTSISYEQALDLPPCEPSPFVIIPTAHALSGI